MRWRVSANANFGKSLGLGLCPEPWPEEPELTEEEIPQLEEDAEWQQ